MTATAERAAVVGRRRRRRWQAWLVGLLMLVAGGVGAGLIIAGSKSTPPPPAPTPDKPFSAAVPPAALLPGDVIPPATGSMTVGVTGAPGRETNAATGARPAGQSHGNSTEPPHHVGPWTFAGSDRLFIESLGVDAPIETVGSDNGGMIIPTDVQQVGRWEGGADLGDPAGTVLIAGHVNYAGQGPGALYDLYRIKPGAVIVTNDHSGVRHSWRVVSLESVNKQALPAGIFTRGGARRLVVVTCGGELLHVDGPNGGYNTYENNVIVQAVPA